MADFDIILGQVSKPKQIEIMSQQNNSKAEMRNWLNNRGIN